jgi:hypothetical protein
MNPRDKIASLTTEIKTLEDHSANLQVEAWSRRQERDELIADLILGEKMLAGTTWELSLGDITNLVHKEAVEGELNKVRELTRKEYHSSFELEEGVNLRFDDSEINLVFDEPKQVLPFIRRNDINILGNKVADRLNSLKREIVALETLCHQFSLLKGKQ